MSFEIIGSYSINVFLSKVILLLKDETIKSGYDIIKELLEKHNIPEEYITGITFEYIDLEKRTMEAHVQYIIMTLEEFRKKSEEEQIRFVLRRMGYKNDEIKSIEYRKDLKKPKWVISIIDKSFTSYFDPFEELRKIEKSLYAQMKEIIEFDFVLNILLS